MGISRIINIYYTYEGGMKMEFKIKSVGVKTPTARFIQVSVGNVNGTWRSMRFELERGNSALALQMNRNICRRADEAIREFKDEFLRGDWNDPRFYNRVV
jgi:hypothetical protein